MEAKKVVSWVLVAILSLFLLVAVGAAVYLGLRWNSVKKSLAQTRTQLTKTQRELKEFKTRQPEVVEKVAEKTPKVPDWVPLYPGFEWTLPYLASITEQEDEYGEPFDWGVMSNRRQGFGDGHEIWQWYRDQLQPQGWECPSSAAGGGAHWGYRCSKGERSILVLSSVWGEPGTDGRATGHPSGLYLRVYWRE